MTSKRTVTQPKQPTEGEVWAKIISVRRSYYVADNDVSGVKADDEAILSITAVLDPAKEFRDLAGRSMDVRLLSSKRYSDDGSEKADSFFGSINLQPKNLSALAYLPAKPFWELPHLISGGATLLCFGFRRWRGRSGFLTSLYVCDEQDRQDLLKIQAPPSPKSPGTKKTQR